VYLGESSATELSSTYHRCGSSDDGYAQPHRQLLYPTHAQSHRRRLGYQGYRLLLRRYGFPRSRPCLFPHPVSHNPLCPAGRGGFTRYRTAPDLNRETKGRPYAELDELFKRKIHARHFMTNKDRSSDREGEEIDQGSALRAWCSDRRFVLFSLELPMSMHGSRRRLVYEF